MTNSHEDYMLWLEVERRTREWGAKFQAMTAELHAKDEQIELARNRADMTAYARRRIAEEADGIAPELVGYISGDSVEQVEASIWRPSRRPPPSWMVSGRLRSLSTSPVPQFSQESPLRPETRARCHRAATHSSPQPSR